MKIYTTKELMKKASELMEILEGYQIVKCEIEASSTCNVLKIAINNIGSKIRVRYEIEVDEDEESGYYFKCYIHTKTPSIQEEHMQRKHHKYNTLDELIEASKGL